MKAQFLVSDTYRKFGDTPRGKYLQTSLEAASAMVCADWEHALAQYAAFLDLDLSRWGKQISEVVAFARDEEVEVARCYRDAGRCLVELNEIEMARKVWKRGMLCRADRGNKPFQNDIQQLLEKHDRRVVGPQNRALHAAGGQLMALDQEHVMVHHDITVRSNFPSLPTTSNHSSRPPSRRQIFRTTRRSATMSVRSTTAFVS